MPESPAQALALARVSVTASDTASMTAFATLKLSPLTWIRLLLTVRDAVEICLNTLPLKS